MGLDKSPFPCYNKENETKEVTNMNELEVIIGILDRIGATYDVCADGTLEIYGGGNRSINLEFDERNQVVEII